MPSWARPIHGDVLTHTISGRPASLAEINSCLNHAFWAAPRRDFVADSAAPATADALCKSVMITRTFYYNTPGGGRSLFSSPDTWQANAFVSYRRKLGKRFGFSSQVNITNVFNHYVFGTLPNNGSGFTNPANLGVSFYGQPRMYVWTNTLTF